MSNLKTETRRAIKIAGLILLLCIGYLCTRVLSDVAENLAANNLLDSFFIGRVMWEIFSSERKVVLQHAPFVTILTHDQQSKKKSNPQDV